MNDTLRIDSYAYLHSPFSGLIPCKVIALRYEAPEPAPMHFDLAKHGISSRYRCDVVITSNQGSYIKGEVCKDIPAYDVVPRSCVKWTNTTGSPNIYAYNVEV